MRLTVTEHARVPCGFYTPLWAKCPSIAPELVLDEGYQQTVATYSEADFEDSRFDYGERVRILLRHPKMGGVYDEAEGTCAAREENVEFEARDGTERTKTLVWLKHIEGYEKPHEDLPDTTQEVDEAWFAEEALRKKEGDPLDGVSFN